MHPHQTLIDAVEAYKTENEKFEVKGNAAAGTRARKALQDIRNAAGERRKEIQASKNATE